jgi:hypothetical protein
MNEALSFQCLLHRGSTRVVAWIEQRRAHGAQVEIKGEEGLWQVAGVYQPPRSAEWLQENAGRARKGLPSTR